jgi:SAM-dependent methyltransferase
MTAVLIGLAMWLGSAPPWASQVVVGQAGKDVVYLPTPAVLVEKMLDLAGVTEREVVVDLGSGDGRIVIAAARRGARAIGIEYDADLVALSRAAAAMAGVDGRATFVQADLFEADFSDATVVTTFLLADVMLRVAPKILALKPGSRLVSNSFTIEGWVPDDALTLENCVTWCTAYLWIVPAKIEGRWRLNSGELVLKQDYQMVSGTMRQGSGNSPVMNGRLRGDRVGFTVGMSRYEGTVNGDVMTGTMTAGPNVTQWSATRLDR